MVVELPALSVIIARRVYISKAKPVVSQEVPAISWKISIPSFLLYWNLSESTPDKLSDAAASRTVDPEIVSLAVGDTQDPVGAVVSYITPDSVPVDSIFAALSVALE